MFQYSYSKLRVAYHDAFRQFYYYMNQDGVVHHDYLCFIMCPSFSAIIRKLVYLLLCSLRDSNNLLVCAMLHSDICLQSSLFGRWHKLLHVF